jgi:predicted nucleic acid-binding Zn ribbon protein
MIELLAAVAGASLSWAAMGAMGRSSRAQSQQDAVVRLTSAVEHIATQLEVMHLDMREERKETFSRLNSVEQRVSKLEATPLWDGSNKRQ